MRGRLMRSRVAARGLSLPHLTSGRPHFPAASALDTHTADPAAAATACCNDSAMVSSSSSSIAGSHMRLRPVGQAVGQGSKAAAGGQGQGSDGGHTNHSTAAVGQGVGVVRTHYPTVFDADSDEGSDGEELERRLLHKYGIAGY